jgi:hypothetical protein
MSNAIFSWKKISEHFAGNITKKIDLILLRKGKIL